MKLIRDITKLLRYGNDVNFNHYLNIEGWLTSSEAKGLHTIAISLPKKAHVVEIGSWKGKSTFCIAHGLKKGTIHCIDPFNAAGEEGSREIYEKQQGEIGLLEQFKSNVARIPKGVNIEILKGYSRDFVGVIPQIDFLFIDGDHSIEGCQFDFVEFEKFITPGGFVAFHDYYPERIELGPTWVVENLVKNNKQFRHYKDFDSLAVFQKIT